VLFALADVLIQKETNVNVFSSLDSLGQITLHFSKINMFTFLTKKIERELI
jgi:hypothetical protein